MAPVASMAYMASMGYMASMAAMAVMPKNYNNNNKSGKKCLNICSKFNNNKQKYSVVLGCKPGYHQNFEKSLLSHKC